MEDAISPIAERIRGSGKPAVAVAMCSKAKSEYGFAGGGRRALSMQGRSSWMSGSPGRRRPQASRAAMQSVVVRAFRRRGASRSWPGESGDGGDVFHLGWQRGATGEAEFSWRWTLSWSKRDGEGLWDNLYGDKVLMEMVSDLATYWRAGDAFLPTRQTKHQLVIE
ncbi:hypothetical protein Acr_25g0008640 [Actinidia rufa]|uniref:Uncharacterized protein n=1 Tax=Actinidia rufa TaxID=165716 RepID=A0A7J0H040_9ERIC|nr:hypothetical protein Acr_25g0008640 [Actinidia rufa]